MSARTCLVLVLCWLVSLVAVGTVASAQLRPYVPLPEPKVFSGADVGFRVEGMVGDMPMGTIVVRVDGRWVAAAEGSAPGVAR